MKYKNPIISGFNPDPSICRVNDDYYLVTSSFEFFPGVPIYHSKNLINWQLIGYCLTEDSQLQLDKCAPSEGIYAPTLRYNNGTFFMTTTNVSGNGNFIVHTDDIAGKWSEPVWVKQGGIDPSLFFDDDGKVYFTSTGNDKDGKQCINMCEIDPYTGRMVTESRNISYGCGGKCPEGPHVYKIGGKYYLMLAEGGTEYGHMETIQRADSPYGPYKPCPHNPTVTHRNVDIENIYCTGHADITEDGKGNWWLVCLAIRNCGNAEENVYLHNLGRETFLAPVAWTDDGWPAVGNSGHLSLNMEGYIPTGKADKVNRDFNDDFSSDKLDLNYNFLRNPKRENYLLEKSSLILKGTDITLNDIDSPTWIGVRQKGFNTITTTTLSLLNGDENSRIGLTAIYNDSYHYEIYISSNKICMAIHIHDTFVITNSEEILSTDNITLKLVTNRKEYIFSYSLDDKEFKELGRAGTAGLCTEGTKTMTFTGTYIGMFAERGEGRFNDFNIEVLED